METNDKHLHIMISEKLDSDISRVCGTERGDKSKIIRAVLRDFISKADIASDNVKEANDEPS